MDQTNSEGYAADQPIGGVQSQNDANNNIGEAEGGFIHIDDVQLPVSNIDVNPGEASEDANKPQFGPQAQQLIAGHVPSIERVNVQPTTRQPQNFSNHVVLMKGITWSRDSHGLFDYESRHLTKKTLKANYGAMIMRSGNDLMLTPWDSKLSFQKQFQGAKRAPEDMAMLKIVNHYNSTFYLESAAFQDHADDLAYIESHGKQQESMYLVVRSLKINNEKIDYEIQERDILKIGRVKFAVKEIGYANQPMDVDSQAMEEKGHSSNSIFTDTNEEEFEEFIKVPATLCDMSHEDPERKCRFCWSTDASEENPLLGTCKCAGSVGQIHYTCLSAWLQSRQQQKLQSNFSTYFWKAFECEICKTPYPLMMKAEGRGYNLVKYDKPHGDYMVLESLSQEKNTSRIIHIIRPSSTKTVFKLGRGHESDLRINDISVSRCHTKIKFERGKFLLEDNQSKFGTLVLVKQRTPLLPGFNKAVQVGRTVINFSVKSQGLQKTQSDPAQASTVDLAVGVSEAQQFPKQDVGVMGVVRANSKITAQPATSSFPGEGAQIQSRMLNRRASEREMPSAEQQFADQMGSMSGSSAPQNNVVVPVVQPSIAQQFNHDDFALQQLPEDVQLQMALQASMQAHNQGQAQGSLGDQDSISNVANEGDE